jgi:hypothetical protein
MSEQTKMYYETDRRGAIRNFVLNEMLRGMGWAAATIAVIVVPLYVLYLLGLFLPEASKNAPPPMPYSQVQTIAPAASA